MIVRRNVHMTPPDAHSTYYFTTYPPEEQRPGGSDPTRPDRRSIMEKLNSNDNNDTKFCYHYILLN